VLARRSYVDLRRRDVVLENEIEAELRSRIAGKHVEISAVTLERIAFAPEVEEAIRKRVVADASSTP
jgi:regulator of protease activity HflC (stomatin/prohibitin superfamily)